MDMGMKLELLSPGVKHAEESDFGTETVGIGGYGLQCFCAGVKQQIVEEFFVLQGQGGEFSGHGEDHMNVRRGQCWKHRNDSDREVCAAAQLGLSRMPRSSYTELPGARGRGDGRQRQC